MGSKLKINPVDLQDREGFLAYLQEQAKEGWEATHIWRTATVFRRTEDPPKGYAMGFDPDGEWPERNEQGQQRVSGHVSTGIGIYPADCPASPDPAWPEAILEKYSQVSQFSHLELGNRMTRILPLLILLILAAQGTDFGRWFFSEFMDLSVQGPIFLVVLVLCILSLIIDLEIWWVDRRHQKGLREARDGMRVYRPDDSLARVIPLKNALGLLETPLSLLEILILCVYIL